MPTWLSAIVSSLPLVGILAAIVWAMIVFHGDTRWLRRPEATNGDGEFKWAPKDMVSNMNVLLLGQNDKIADHDNRIDRLEEREEERMARIEGHLTTISADVKDISERVIRLEEHGKQRRAND